MPTLERQIEGLDQALVERVVEKLLALEPEATAVLLTGSYATERAALASDLDLMAITPSPRIGYRTWFEEQGTDEPLHVSAGATTAQEWLADGAEPARLVVRLSGHEHCRLPVGGGSDARASWHRSVAAASGGGAGA